MPLIIFPRQFFIKNVRSWVFSNLCLYTRGKSKILQLRLVANLAPWIHFRVNSLLSLNAATLVITVQFMFLHLSRMKWIICLLQLEDGFCITSEGWIIYVTEMFEQIKIWCYCKIWDFLGLQIIFICNICICFNVKIYICIKPV